MATWAASPIATNIAAAPAKPVATPVAGGAPAAAPAKPGPAPLRSFNNQTIRMVVNTSIGGRSVRVELANTFGADRLKIGSAHIALRDHDSAIVPASDRKLTFSGLDSATIPPGASMISDPVDLSVPAVGNLVVSVYIPGDSGPPTQHATGLHTTYISSDGDFTGQPDFTPARTSNSWYFLSGVQVLAPADAGVIVAFGDSITDGATSTTDADAAWPSALARRLQAAGATNLAVVNEGISGNRVLGRRSRCQRARALRTRCTGAARHQIPDLHGSHQRYRWNFARRLYPGHRRGNHRHLQANDRAGAHARH